MFVVSKYFDLEYRNVLRLVLVGYTQENIICSEALAHPFLQIGSKKRHITLIPDYILKVKNNYAWILEAKAPNQGAFDSDNLEQAYNYAVYSEMGNTYFALCNSLEFSLFKTFSIRQLVLYFKSENIDENWGKLITFLSPASFQTGKGFIYELRETTGGYEQ